jgi:hypothetical protein
MTGLIVAAFGVCAVALVALGYAVFSLRSEVDSMARQVDALAGTAGTVPLVMRSPRSGERADADPTSAVSTVEERAVPLVEERAVPLVEERAVPIVEEPVVPVTVDEPAVLITDMSNEGSEPEPTVSRVVSVTLAGPLIKVAALSHGLQRALSEDSRTRITHAFRRELKQQRKLRRRQPVRRAASPGGRS